MSIKTGRGNKKTAPQKSKSDRYLEKKMPATKTREAIMGKSGTRNA